VTAIGTYSGKLVNGKFTYSLSGRFDSEGRATNVMARANGTPLRVALKLDLDEAGQLRGDVYTSSWESKLVADKLTRSAKANPAPEAGT
jgi:hypothetical protein